MRFVVALPELRLAWLVRRATPASGAVSNSASGMVPTASQISSGTMWPKLYSITYTETIARSTETTGVSVMSKQMPCTAGASYIVR